MAITKFKEVGYTLSKLLDDIQMGEIGLPEIQRPFIWPNTKVRNLFDSMYKGFPVGYLLFWANRIGDGSRQIGTDVKLRVPYLLIIDGQQRLTSLYAVMKRVPVVRNNYQTEIIRIAFNPLKEIFDVTDVAIEKDPEYIPDISLIWASDIGIFKLVDSYLSRLKSTREISPEDENKIKSSINKLDNIESFPFSILEISGDATEEEVSDIFVRINSEGTSLNQADFILTLMSVFWDQGRFQLEEFCKQTRIQSENKPSPYNHLIKPNPDQMIRVDIGFGFKRARLKNIYNILRGKDIDTGEFSDKRREEQFSILKSAQSKILNIQTWQEFLKCIIQAGYRSQDMITSEITLLYAYVFFLIGKYDFNLSPHLLRKLIARWFFATEMVSRYTGSFESLMEQDLSRLRDIHSSNEFVAYLNKIIDETLTDDYWEITLPNELNTSSARTPVLFAYYASLNLLNAQVLFSEIRIPELLDPTIKSKKAPIERHHLFPKGYLKKIGINERRITNTLANYALVEWSDNIEISDNAPFEYVPKYEKRFSTKVLNQMYYWHALPKNWYNLDYGEFVQDRQKRIAKVIRKGFEKLNM